MSPPEVGALLATVLAESPDELDREGCHRRLRDLCRLRNVLGGEEIRTTRRLKALAADGRCEPAEAALGDHGGLSGRDAGRAADREEIAGSLPGFEDALSDGEVTAGHLDALAAAVQMLEAHPELVEEFRCHEEDLLGHAAGENVDVFRRRCRTLAKSLIARADAASAGNELARQQARSTVRTWTDKATGMFHLHAEVDPERGAILDRQLQLELARLRAEDQQTGDQPTAFMQLKVNALVTALSSSGDGVPGRPELVVHVDWQWLLDAMHDNAVSGYELCETVDGVALPVDTVRRLACDADILPAVMNGDGLVKDMGRSTRTATPAQRARLSAMYATCGHRECKVAFSKCRIHHIRFWGLHGPTDEDNLIPLCDKHHHLVHEGGWTLQMTPDRVATWRLPDGTVYFQGPTINRRDQVAAA
jgi:hypothetical protein